MKNWLIMSIALIALSIPTACRIDTPQDDSPAVITGQLGGFAKAFAEVVLNDSVLADRILDETSKRFDGDSEVLFSMIEDFPLASGTKAPSGSPTLGAEMIRRLNASARSLSQVAEREDLNIYAFSPVASAEMPRLVAYVDYTLEEGTGGVIRAYDASGATLELSADDSPEYAVFVVGLNERVDLDGDIPDQAGAQERGSISDGEALKLSYVKLIDDLEPWYSGAAEFCVMVRDADAAGNAKWVCYLDVPSVDYAGNTYTLNTRLFNWSASGFDDLVTLTMFERDSSIIYYNAAQAIWYNPRLEGDGIINNIPLIPSDRTGLSSPLYSSPGYRTVDDPYAEYIALYSQEANGYLIKNSRIEARLVK